MTVESDISAAIQAVRSKPKVIVSTAQAMAAKKITAKNVVKTKGKNKEKGAKGQEKPKKIQPHTNYRPMWEFKQAERKFSSRNNGTYFTVIANDAVIIDNGLQKTKVNQNDLFKIAKKIDSLSHSSSTYRNVMNNKDWMEMYQADSRDVTYITGTKSSQIKTDTLPCHVCGIVLPTEYIQVDHHHPQKGGTAMAVMKVLRATGCANAGPAGAKGSYTLHSTAVPKIDTRRGGTVDHLNTRAGAISRYQLNDTGELFISLLYGTKRDSGINQACLNSMINLVPLCSKCNGSKNDKLKTIH